MVLAWGKLDVRKKSQTHRHFGQETGTYGQMTALRPPVTMLRATTATRGSKKQKRLPNNPYYVSAVCRKTKMKSMAPTTDMSGPDCSGGYTTIVAVAPARQWHHNHLQERNTISAHQK